MVTPGMAFLTAASSSGRSWDSQRADESVSGSSTATFLQPLAASYPAGIEALMAGAVAAAVVAGVPATSQTPLPASAGRPLQTSATATNLSAITVLAMLALVTATGTARAD